MLSILFLSPSLPNLSSKSNSTFHSYIPISSSSKQKPPHSPKLPNNASIPHHSFSLTSSAENPDSGARLQPMLDPDNGIKMPTAPWMKGPLVLPPHEVLDLSKPPRKTKLPDKGKAENSHDGLTGKAVGIRGKNAVKNIVRSIENLGQNVNLEQTREGSGKSRIGDCLERVGKAAAAAAAGDSRNDGKMMPWEREEGFVFRRMKKERAVSAAELRLEKELLMRLRGEAAKMRQWVKVKKAGVTQAVVDSVKLIWKRNELAMIKFDVPLCRNMDRAQEIVETKTGGLVVWRKKDTLVVYRWCDYQSTLKTVQKMYPNVVGSQETTSLDLIPQNLRKGNAISQVKSYVHEKMINENAKVELMPTGISLDNNVNCQPTTSSLYERESDRLLDGLGPRFIDWWMHKPLPVDADLLPEVINGFRPPVRRCPPNTRAKLTDDELTYFRKLAQPLPTHFVLGRNRKLQGLAAAILKLWEKSPIAKIAVKLGIPNTDNEQMACELKAMSHWGEFFCYCLTGGVLLLRNKYIIILYRGKDFLPGELVDLISEREMELEKFQLHEEHARIEAIEALSAADVPKANTGFIGTLSEFQDIQTAYGDLRKGNAGVKLPLEAEKERLERELRKQERKLFILDNKIKKSAKELLRLNAAWMPAEGDADQEMLTEEERESFRRIGLKMHSCLVLVSLVSLLLASGRRGVFDGVIEGLHQHWKHREVVKVMTMQRLFQQVMYTAKLLEAESGGILVSVDKLKEGHAIIIYRGKNYQRSSKPISGNLLTKRKALSRSLEMQRIGSLKFFAYQTKQAISDLKLKLVKL
ncbi:hypothetical protein FEM48_Zijuj04G0112200 [Ziziphus jujuba var. spinosa]|uniref:CRM domain-containing protein n=1 Tax=Ziziphus jujuba var. spinosa TaxID=714518 RepID=A0A978VJJ5_ZIZJJ|nr:hypothetical protein FEM48_Zijuj04G0112200 [Ziziphus jujuba var. spinosa]